MLQLAPSSRRYGALPEPRQQVQPISGMHSTMLGSGKLPRSASSVRKMRVYLLYVVAANVSACTEVLGTTRRDTGIVVDATAVTLHVDQQEYLAVFFVDGDGSPLPPSNTPVAWTSRNPSIASVSDAGVVSAQSPGFTVIVATAGGGQDSALVRVVDQDAQSTVVFDGISAGSAHSCAVIPMGRVYCWGTDWHGELGDGHADKLKITLSPLPASGALIVRELDVGNEHTCAVASDRRTYCWGDNLYGQLGDGTTAARASPTPIRTDSMLVSVSAGGAAACGLTGSGAALCWGRIGTIQDPLPSVIQTAARYAGVSVGGMHACGLMADGILHCWGCNDYGQLGDGSTNARQVPARVGGEERYLSVSAGYLHTCAVSQAGVVFCWGNNFSGRLGTGSEAPSASPKAVALPAGARSVSAGSSHSCAVTVESRIYCWGSNSRGQLGNNLAFAAPGTDPSAYRSASPVLAVAPGVTFSAVTAGGGDHTCALSAAGFAYCWGANGPLGVGRRERVTPDGVAVLTVPTRTVDPFLL